MGAADSSAVKVMIGFASILVFFLAWELAVRLLDPDPSVLPSVTSVGQFMALNAPLLLWHGGVTLFEAMAGLVVASIAALALNLVYFLHPRLALLFDPPVMIVQGFPKEALAPVLVAWIGFGLGSKIILASSVSFFVIYLGLKSHIRAIPDGYMHYYFSLRLSRAVVTRRFLARYILPEFILLMQPAWLLSVIGAVIAEFVGAEAGLGHLIQVFSGQLRMPGVFASLISLGLVSYAGAALFAAVVRIVTPWYFVNKAAST